jgi:hypothetical protein
MHEWSRGIPDLIALGRKWVSSIVRIPFFSQGHSPIFIQSGSAP